MGCSCIGRKKSKNEIESKTEAGKKEEEVSGATGIDANTNYEALSEQELVEKVRSAYEDFLQYQGLGGTTFSRANFENKFTKYVAYERAYLKKLGIDHNDAEKVKSVLDPILQGVGTQAKAGAESTPVMSDISVVAGDSKGGGE